MLGIGFESTLGEIAEGILVPAAGAIREIPFLAVVRADSVARNTIRSSSIFKGTHWVEVHKDPVEDPVVEAERGERVTRPP